MRRHHRVPPGSPSTAQQPHSNHIQLKPQSIPERPMDIALDATDTTAAVAHVPTDAIGPIKPTAVTERQTAPNLVVFTLRHARWGSVSRAPPCRQNGSNGVPSSEARLVDTKLPQRDESRLHREPPSHPLRSTHPSQYVLPKHHEFASSALMRSSTHPPALLRRAQSGARCNRTYQ